MPSLTIVTPSATTEEWLAALQKYDNRCIVTKDPNGDLTLEIIGSADPPRWFQHYGQTSNIAKIGAMELHAMRVKAIQEGLFLREYEVEGIYYHMSG